MEIASDTSSKFQLDASTPNKYSKKNSSFKDISFSLNTENNDSISYQENNQFQESSGLSFLANGFNNLKIKTGMDFLFKAMLLVLNNSILKLIKLIRKCHNQNFSFISINRRDSIRR